MSEPVSIFDKHLSQKQKLASDLISGAVLKGRLANAYLLTGRRDEDKWQIAKQMAAYLNCERTKSKDESLSLSKDQSCLAKSISGLAVSMCRDCRWISEDAHPECLHKLAPAGTASSRKISVASARAMTDLLSRTTSAFRVVIVEDASQDVFHRPSANALLKTLEEPPANTLFFLFADSAEAVLPTVVSRSQVVPVPQVPFSDADALEVALFSFHKQIKDSKQKAARGCLSAIELAQVIMKTADDLVEDDENARVAYARVIDHAIGEEYERLKQSAISSSADAQYLHDLLKLGQDSKQKIDHYVSPKATLEGFSMAWMQLAHASGVS